MTADLLVIVPTRGRPDSLCRVVQAWQDTDAFSAAEPLFVVDADDPALPEYGEAFRDVRLVAGGLIRRRTATRWEPMVPKLNTAATDYARLHPFIGFAGDDHLPRTPGWASAYTETLRELGTGIVYGNDLIQGEALPTQWAMTSDIIGALGRMVPAPVEHMFCDDSILKLGQAASCIRYLPDVVIEHQHPIAGTAPDDDGYRRVNSQAHLYRDRLAYGGWLAGHMAADVDTVRKLRQA